MVCAKNVLALGELTDPHLQLAYQTLQGGIVLPRMPLGWYFQYVVD